MAGSGPVNNQTPFTTQTTLPSANAGGAGQAQEGTWNSVKVTTSNFKGEPVFREGTDFKPTSMFTRAVRSFNQVNLLPGKGNGVFTSKTWGAIPKEAALAQVSGATKESVDTLEGLIDRHNKLAAKLETLETDKNAFQGKVDEFKKEWGSTLKFLDKVKDGKDFKQGAKVTIPDEQGNPKTGQLLSRSKGANFDKAQQMANEVRSRPEFKTHFDNKHFLGQVKDEIAQIKEELHQLKDQHLSAFKKARSEVHEGNKDLLRNARDLNKQQVKADYSYKKSEAKESYQETKQNIRDTAQKTDERLTEVRQGKKENNDLIKGDKKKLSDANSRLGRGLAWLAKKAMPKVQEEAYFTGSGKDSMDTYKEAVGKELKTHEDTRASQKEATAALKKGKKEAKKLEWEAHTRHKGASPFAETMAEMGIYTKAGIGTGGELERLKDEKTEALKQEKKNYKKSRAAARKEKKADTAAFNDLVSGRAKQTKQASEVATSKEPTAPVSSQGVDRDSGVGDLVDHGTVLNKFNNNLYSTPEEWQADISQIDNPGSLNALEDVVQSWNTQQDGWGEILEFIQKQRGIQQ
ncbi:hypothetical protein [Endozoicomonas sp.]|uniref:hypothetical protein n=1 Tax=Endozoicomonas sp. TaxID=1892382 RepID=UPI003AF4D6E6